jgi:flagellar protein FlaF
VGFSVSGSAVVVFVGFIVAAGLAIPTLAGTISDVTESQGEQIDRGVNMINTDLKIERSVYNETTDELRIEVTNTGSTTLTVRDTSLLVDDALITNVTREIAGVQVDTKLWKSGEQLNMTVENVASNDNVNATQLERVKIVAENGVDDVELNVERVQ